MKSRPILFSAPMVRAILDGRKTMTRRVIKPQPTFPDAYLSRYLNAAWQAGEIDVKCPYGQLGDQLWVLETWQACEKCDAINYRANTKWKFEPYSKNCIGCDAQLGKWKPSIFMPRHACRITLEIASVRVERLNEIDEEDAAAEGCHLDCMTPTGDDNGSFIWGPSGFLALWESINGAGSWDLNPWVWVVEFKKL